MLSHRERFFTALDLKEPDVVPITDLGLDPPIVEEVLGVRIGEISAFAVRDARETWNSAVRNRLMMVKACLKLDFDAVPAVSDYLLYSFEYKPKFIDENRFIDEWGRVMEARSDTKTTWWVDGVVKTLEDMENYTPPDPSAPGRVEMIEKMVREIRGRDTVIMGQCHSGWHLAFQVRGGIDKLILDFYMHPAEAKRFVEKIAKTCLEYVKLMIDGGVEVIFVTDDYADNHGPLINPKLFREFELQNLKRIIDYGKRKGVPIMKHSDGNLYPILDDMVNAGIAALHPVEPGAMDLKDVKERYGDRICLAGNVDCRYVLPFGTEEEVRRDVRRCIDAAAEGGGFILTSSNSIHANCKVENVLYMVDEARKYGRYERIRSRK